MSLVTKKRGSTDYLYDQSSDSGRMKATYLGKVGDPKTDAKVAEFGESEKKRKDEKKAKKKSGVLESVDAGMNKALGPVPFVPDKQTPKKQAAKNSFLEKDVPFTSGRKASKTDGYVTPEDRHKRNKTGLVF